MLGDLRPGDRVLVTKIDRAARNVRDLLDLVEHIEEAGASIVSIEQNIDTSGPIGKFILVVLAAIAELEPNITGERRRESLVAFANEGRHAVGAAPFGFKSVDNPNGRGLVIRPDWDAPGRGEQSPAAILRDAIRRVMGGEPQARVVEDLPIKEAGFSVLLRNARLAGMTPSGDGVVNSHGVPQVDPEAALLTMAEWSELRDYMKRPEKRSWSRQEGYGPALTCSECSTGATVVRRGRTTTATSAVEPSMNGARQPPRSRSLPPTRTSSRLSSTSTATARSWQEGGPTRPAPRQRPSRALR